MEISEQVAYPLQPGQEFNQASFVASGEMKSEVWKKEWNEMIIDTSLPESKATFEEVLLDDDLEDVDDRDTSEDETGDTGGTKHV